VRLSVFYDHVREAASQLSLSIPEVLRRSREAGITGVDCPIEALGCERSLASKRSPTSDGHSFARDLAAEGITVASTYAFFDFANYSDAADFAFAQRVVETTAASGAKVLLAVPGFVPLAGRSVADPAYVALVDAARGHMARALDRLVAVARPLGVTVAVEDFDDATSPVATSSGMRWFLDRVEGLRCVFDTGNFRYSGEDELAALDSLLPFVCHAHCKDRSLDPASGGEAKPSAVGETLYPASVGGGVVRMGEVVDRLLATGYDGWFAIEHFGASDQLAYLRRSAAWLLSRGAKASAR